MTIFKPFFKISLLFIVCLLSYAQQGGMWIPSLLEGINEKEMKSLGMQISAKDIYDHNNNSLKDAIVHFGGGCTSEIISAEGLLLTNHHCGYRQIQNHSSVENNYLQNGFWARSKEQELANPGLTASIIVKIEDVTSQVLHQTNLIENTTERNQKIQANIQNIINQYPKETWQDCSVRSFYYGNQYLLFVIETFKDVRLVGTPPSSIGKFGSDTDNWVWPRHTGDFALFRIYADKNNKPAAYAQDNVPYKPKHFLPVATYGVQEDDFTLVFGFPGRTQEYLPAVAVEQIVEVLNPAKIKIREIALGIQDKFMRNDEAIKIKYASQYASVANYWKKWIGENQGLKKSNAVAHKKAFEKRFLNDVAKQNETAIYGNLFNDFNQLYNQIETYALGRDYFMEVVMRNCEFLNHGYRLYLLNQVLNNRGVKAFDEAKKNQIAVFEGLFKNYEKAVDEQVFEALITLYLNESPQEFLPENLKNKTINPIKTYYENSILHSLEDLKNLLSMNAAEFQNALKKDEGYQLVNQLTQAYELQIKPQFDALNNQIEELQTLYMKGILNYSKPEDRIFPDANSTLRVTYGKVKGYSPADAIMYKPISYLEGILEKYQPGDYEFDVPKKLIHLYETKDYGNYGYQGQMPVCFIATNHTTGGNSGSPAIDAFGNLVGLNFDRVWEGTMSDIYYDPEICRNIMVDARYILFIIDKYANAKQLINEMSLVNKKPKLKNKKLKIK